jgi:hypothetical protein
MRVRFVQFVAGAACLALGGLVAAQTEIPGVPRALLDRRLQERPVLLVGIDSHTITYTDAAGLVRTEPTGEFIAILPALAGELPKRIAQPAPPATSTPESRPFIGPGDLLAARPTTVLELVDGQRFAGSLIAPDASRPGNPESLAWSHPLLGPLEVKIDRVRRIRLSDPAPASPAAGQPAKDDVVIFANGDRLEGFVESIGAKLKVVPGSDPAAPAREFDLGVVREIVFANPPQPWPSSAALVWLRDGSVIACRGITTGRLGDVTLAAEIRNTEAAPSESPESSALLRLEDLLAVAFDPAALEPLASLTPVDTRPIADRRWTKPSAVLDADRAVLGAADIGLPGPMSVAWDLPRGASRLAAEALLPRPMWTWGDCEIVVLLSAPTPGAAETELFRGRLNSDHPRARISAALGEPAADRRLHIRLEPGNFGPIQDQVVLKRPMLLMEKVPG